jgi:Zn-finger nucleic acid-binding protein
MDPYRGGLATGICPRCNKQATSDGELQRMRCLGGCGEFYPRARLEQHVEWSFIARPPRPRADGWSPVASSWPWGAAPCPVCRADMSVGFRANLRYDYCTQHGVWLDAGELSQFASLFVDD